MKRRLLELIACMVLSGVSQAGATVYDLVGTSGIGVSGTITTDGATGVLTASDITSWDINQTNDTVHFIGNLSPPNSTVSLTGNALTATATQLLFDYGDTTSSLLDFASNNFSGGSGGLSLQFCDATATCTNQNGATFNSLILLVLVAPGLGATDTGMAESGLTAIGAASSVTPPTVPEPSTWAMALIGFAGLGFLAWRSQNRAAAAT